MIVTGASSGIGSAVSLRAQREGWRVFGWDRHIPDASPHPSHPPLTHHIVDITDPIHVEEALDEIEAISGRGADAVVHCAGVYRTGSAIAVELDDWIEVISINLVGSFIVARAIAARSIRAGSPASIVLLSSVASLRGDRIEPSSAYAASKGGIESLARQLAVEWSGSGVRCNVVIPGVIDTPMTTITGHSEAHSALVARLPAGRLGRAEEVAAACLFLAGKDAQYVTGESLRVDGGYAIS
ncbi:MAG: SDR family NAD(P)-dependent oxidoreductase [Microbacteriaceae bacterium]